MPAVVRTDPGRIAHDTATTAGGCVLIAGHREGVTGRDCGAASSGNGGIAQATGNRALPLPRTFGAGETKNRVDR